MPWLENTIFFLSKKLLWSLPDLISSTVMCMPRFFQISLASKLAAFLLSKGMEILTRSSVSQVTWMNAQDYWYCLERCAGLEYLEPLSKQHAL
jgi:ABC-type polysaccharide transport system permease subunit